MKHCFVSDDSSNMFLFKRLTSSITIPNRVQRFVSSKSTIDRSLVPRLDEHDLEEQFVRGSGPGGQVVNKTANCVVLRHKPSGLIVKCHAHRMMQNNRTEARRLMVIKLDNLWNGENSVAQQELALQKRKSVEANRRRRKSDEMKQKWREREKDLLERE